MVTNHEADILTGIDNEVHWANQHNLMLTDSYLSSSIVLVKNKKGTEFESRLRRSGQGLSCGNRIR